MRTEHQEAVSRGMRLWWKRRRRAQGIEAGTDETRSGSAEGESPTPEGMRSETTRRMTQGKPA